MSRLRVNKRPPDELRRLNLREDRDMWKRYAMAAADDPRLQMCGIVCTCGPNLEPLACAYDDGHDGEHSWATLPTFGPDGQVTEAALPALLAENDRLREALRQISEVGWDEHLPPPGLYMPRDWKPTTEYADAVNQWCGARADAALGDG